MVAQDMVWRRRVLDVYCCPEWAYVPAPAFSGMIEQAFMVRDGLVYVDAVQLPFEPVDASYDSAVHDGMWTADPGGTTYDQVAVRGKPWRFKNPEIDYDGYMEHIELMVVRLLHPQTRAAAQREMDCYRRDNEADILTRWRAAPRVAASEPPRRKPPAAKLRRAPPSAPPSAPLSAPPSAPLSCPDWPKARAASELFGTLFICG